MTRRRPTALLVAALVCLAALPAAAEPGAVTRTRLANGMTILVRENPVAPVVAMSSARARKSAWYSFRSAPLTARAP